MWNVATAHQYVKKIACKNFQMIDTKIVAIFYIEILKNKHALMSDKNSYPIKSTFQISLWNNIIFSTILREKQETFTYYLKKYFV